MKEKAQAAHARAFLRSSASTWLLRTTQPARLGIEGQQLRTDDNDDDPNNGTQQQRSHTFPLVIWFKFLIILWQHDGQNRLTVVTGANMGDDIDDFFPSWSHQEVDLEGDPVGVHSFPGGKQRQDHQIMEPAADGLPLSIESGWWFDVSVKQVIGDHRLELEADSFRLLGDVDQDAIGDGLGT